MKQLTPFLLLLTFFLFAGVCAAQEIEGWRPVPQDQLAMKTPVVEADADAEAIFWEVWLDDKKRNKLFYTHYVRVKIFTERGREKFSKFDIPFGKGKKVEDVAARVIKPDGTIIELKPTEIFERDILTVGKLRIRAKSFAVPGIEPGVIVEYRYKETFKGDSADGERLYFQRDIPMQRAVYHIRPYANTSLGYDFHNVTPVRFVPSDDGFNVATMTNVPAFKSEPQMPPEEETRYWVSLNYQGFGGFSWSVLSRNVGMTFGKLIEPSKEITQKAGELTDVDGSDDEKLKRLYEFAQKQIRNISFDTSITDEQRANTKIKDANDVLKRQMGNHVDVIFLFASLARAAGFEVFFVLSGDRSENFFDPNRDVGASYVHPAGVAVRSQDGWKILNPGVPFLPYGKLPWFEEGSYAMLVNENTYVWRKNLLSDHNQSPAKRTGKFKLSEDGTLEGSVVLEYEGQRAITRRREEFRNSPAKREENIKEEIKQQTSTAEISEFSIENFDDPAKPLIYKYKMRVPNYAQKTGKRIFFQPGVFEYGSTPLFSSAKRVHPIYFNYAWADEDNIEIDLPKGFIPENTDPPGDVLENTKIGELKISIWLDKAANSLKYKRKFYFGGGGKLFFPVKAYEPLKFLFDNFHKADMHSVTLRQSD